MGISFGVGVDRDRGGSRVRSKRGLFRIRSRTEIMNVNVLEIADFWVGGGEEGKGDFGRMSVGITRFLSYSYRCTLTYLGLEYFRSGPIRSIIELYLDRT